MHIYMHYVVCLGAQSFPHRYRSKETVGREARI